jgi:ATP-dependent helicase HrpB
MIHLPIDDHLSDIEASLQKNPCLVIEAQPGTGKTTRIPPYLLKSNAGKILVLEPRRIAALSSAARVADERGWTLGQEVGYQVRFDNRTSPATRLIYLTEALLSRKLLQDPILKGIDLVILDEFHERSLHTDLALGLLFELRELSRPDLKIIVMSATLDGARISEYLGNCPRIQAQGESHPLEKRNIQWPQILRFGPDLADRIVEQIKTLNDRKSILVFLPGVGEIRAVERELSHKVRDFEILTLHGNLSLSEQRKVLTPTQGKRIILCTNIAESALTIDGVDTVLDTGLAKTVRWNSQTGSMRLSQGRIAKANARQRAGRAARQGPGLVIQLWNKSDELAMADFEVPSLLREDLCETILTLAALGVSGFDRFSWFEAPPNESLDMAIAQLKSWGALDSFGKITEMGQQMSKLSTHPRLSRLLLEGQILQCSDFAADIAALLSEKFPFSKDLESLHQRWEIFQEHQNDSKFGLLRKASDQFRKALPPRNQKYPHSKQALTLLPELLLSSHQDRLCRKRSPDSLEAQIFYGKGVSLPRSARPQEVSEYFLAMDLIETDSRTTLVSCFCDVPSEFVQKKWGPLIQWQEQFSLDPESKRLLKSQVQKLGSWTLSDPKHLPVTNEDIQNHYAELLLPFWPQILQSNQGLANDLNRWDWYLAKNPQLQAHALKGLTLLQAACLTQNRFEDLLEFSFQNLVNLEISEQLGPAGLALFNRNCPRSFKAPSGQTHNIKYHLDKNPELEIRLQELFGLNSTPSVLNGEIALRLHLLGPNFRPVQVTQDLLSFWKNTYPEVRKELRLRYPKHSWPEDPQSAVAVAKGSRRT